MGERCVGNEMQYLIYLLLRDGLVGYIHKRDVGNLGPIFSVLLGEPLC